jgi:hypothetical protein
MFRLPIPRWFVLLLRSSCTDSEACSSSSAEDLSEIENIDPRRSRKFWLLARTGAVIHRASTAALLLQNLQYELCTSGEIVCSASLLVEPAAQPQQRSVQIARSLRLSRTADDIEKAPSDKSTWVACIFFLML